MQVQMAVDVIERQAGGSEAGELLVNFRAQLFAQSTLEKITKANARRIFAELTARIDEAGDFFRRQRGTSAEQCEMQADAELRVFFRQRDGFGAIGFIDHQACTGQNAFAVRTDDGFVDGARAPEIVGIDDEAA